MKRRKIRRNPPTRLDFSMAKAGDKNLGEFEIDKGNGEYDVWTIIKRGRVFLIGTPTNTGLLSEYYYKMDAGESEQNALQEINSDLEALAQDGEKYMSLVKRIPKKISPNRRRGLRRNQTPLERLRYHVSGAIARGEAEPIVEMRSHNSRGQKLYVVITADGTPLSGRIGTLEPPGPIFYTKGEAIKKGRMFRGRVVSVENYYKMGRGLRRNGADHKRHRWQIFGYDVLGNADDGWEVNNVLPGPVITMSYKAEYDKKTFDSAMSRAGVNLRWALIDNGASDEDTIYFNTASGKPLAEMRRVK